MGRFTAAITTFGGKPAIRLAYKENPHDTRRIEIWLAVHHLVPPYDKKPLERYPFAYQYLDATPQRRYPIIKVVAGPGVTMWHTGWPDGFWKPEFDKLPDLHVVRVQDVDMIPPIGVDLSTFPFIGSYEAGDPPPPLSSTIRIGLPSEIPPGSPKNFFIVHRQQNGVVIQHPASNEQLIVKVAHFDKTGQARDAGHRFAYEIDPGGKLMSLEQPMLKIVKTPGVEITTTYMSLTEGSPPIGSLLDNFYRIWETDSIKDVPPQGRPLVPESSWRDVKTIKRIPPPPHRAGRTAQGVRAVISLIPLVGDGVDITELLFAITTGEDFLGQNVDAVDLVLMSVAAVLPFVGPTALRGGRQLLAKFGTKADVAQEWAEAVARANLDAEDVKVLQAVEKSVVSGARLAPETVERYVKVLEKVQTKRPSIDDILSVGEKGFVNAEIQESYQAYVASKLKKKETPAGPREYALRLARGGPRATLEKVLGKDYVERAKMLAIQRPVNIGDIPRPARLTDDVVRKLLGDLIRDNREKLTERLGKFFARTPTDPIEAALFRARINPGHFRILKGNVAEILGMPLQRQVLAEIIKKTPEFKNARILSGIRFRIKGDKDLSRALLFTDNVVAVESKGNLFIVGVFEVKSGYRGGSEATEQVFDWIEKRVTDGSELVIPAGSKVIAADGTEVVVKKERTFRYDPDGEGTGRVIWLQRAERHLITTKGVSALGMNSAMQIAAPVSRRELELASDEIDYLVGQIFATYFPK